MCVFGGTTQQEDEAGQHGSRWSPARFTQQNFSQILKKRTEEKMGPRWGEAGEAGDSGW